MSWPPRRRPLATAATAAILTEAEELKTALGIPTTFSGKRLRADSKFVLHANLFVETFDFVRCAASRGVESTRRIAGCR